MFRLAVRQSARSVNARWNSSIANVAFEDKPFYEAPMAQSVKIMKAVSVTSCAISVFGLPGLLVAMSPENIDIMGQVENFFIAVFIKRIDGHLRNGHVCWCWYHEFVSCVVSTVCGSHVHGYAR